MKKLLVVVSVLLATTTAAVDPPVVRAVVFKNGIGFLSRTPSIEFKEGKASIEGMPQAAYGGLWIAAERRGVAIERAVARTTETPRVRAVSSIPELLDANDGRKVTVEAGDRQLSGMLSARSDSSFVTIEANGKSTSIAKAAIEAMTVSGTPGTTRETMEPGVVIDLFAGDVSGTVPMTITSLERGIGWTPEYEIRIGSEGRAELTLRAALINDAAVFENAEVLFAVGYPSFEFARIRTPLDPSQSLDQFIRSLTSSGWQRPAGPMMNVMTQGVVRAGPAESLDAELPDELTEGETQQDLYLYRKTGVDLKKGERAAIPLTKTRAPFTHTWNWTITDTSRISVYGYPENRSREELRDQVWHSIRLENGSQVPWTTGPALVLEGSTPIAQNTLHYTPTGGATTLRLTVASDIAAEHSEIEKARSTESLRKFGTTYEGIDYEGTLTVTNHRHEAVTVEATRTLTGAVSTSGEGGSSVRLAEEPSVINPRSRIDWNIAVDAGKTKTVSYKYRVWVRR